MFSCFIKCCTKKKNSITNYPIKKISDGTLQNVRSQIEVANPKNYNIFAKVRSDLNRLKISKQAINSNPIQHINSM